MSGSQCPGKDDWVEWVDQMSSPCAVLTHRDQVPWVAWHPPQQGTMKYALIWVPITISVKEMLSGQCSGKVCEAGDRKRKETKQSTIWEKSQGDEPCKGVLQWRRAGLKAIPSPKVLGVGDSMVTFPLVTDCHPVWRIQTFRLPGKDSYRCCQSGTEGGDWEYQDTKREESTRELRLTWTASVVKDLQDLFKVWNIILFQDEGQHRWQE